MQHVTAVSVVNGNEWLLRVNPTAGLGMDPALMSYSRKVIIRIFRMSAMRCWQDGSKVLRYIFFNSTKKAMVKNSLRMERLESLTDVTGCQVTD